MIRGVELTSDNSRASICIIDGKKWPCIVYKDVYVYIFYPVPKEISDGGYLSDEPLLLSEVEEVEFVKEEFLGLIDKLRAEIYSN